MRSLARFCSLVKNLFYVELPPRQAAPRCILVNCFSARGEARTLILEVGYGG